MTTLTTLRGHTNDALLQVLGGELALRQGFDGDSLEARVVIAWITEAETILRAGQGAPVAAEVTAPGLGPIVDELAARVVAAAGRLPSAIVAPWRTAAQIRAVAVRSLVEAFEARPRVAA